MTSAGSPVVLIADKLAQSTVTALGEDVEVRWVDGPDRPKLLEAVVAVDEGAPCMDDQCECCA